LPERRYSFEEFKVYYDSTELVSDRRIATTRWNYSVGVAVFGGIALLLNWGFEHRQYLDLALIGALLLAGVAAAFSYLWLRQIDDYKALNNAKFTVLNEMAPNILFSVPTSSAQDSGPDLQLVSYEPFLREWRKLQESRSLIEVRGRNRLSALSASNIERFIPKCFFGLFVATTALSLLLGLANWSTFTHSVSCTIGGLNEKACLSKP
jgi:hypothetical protein